MSKPDDPIKQDQQSTALTDEMSARLDAVIDRAVAVMREQLHTEVRDMFRFNNMDEVPAARIVLAEHGEPMTVEAIAEYLMSGGIWREVTGSKGSTAAAEIKKSLSQSARHGVHLKYFDKEGRIVGLSEWEDGKWPKLS